MKFANIFYFTRISDLCYIRKVDNRLTCVFQDIQCKMKGVLIIHIYIDAWSLNESVYPLFNRESRAGVLDSTCILSCLYFLKTNGLLSSLCCTIGEFGVI